MRRLLQHLRWALEDWLWAIRNRQAYWHLRAVLCARGIHRLTWHAYCSGGYGYEPPEPGWCCAWCGEDGIPLEIRIQEWVWSHVPLRWYADWENNYWYERMLEEDQR